MEKTYVEMIDWQTLNMVQNFIAKLKHEAMKNTESSDIQKDFMLIVQGMQIVADKFLEA